MDFESCVSLLGNEEFVVLQMIMQGCNTVEDICQFTGLPSSCVRTKVEVLQSLGFIEKSNKGLVVTNKGFEWVANKSGANLIIV